MNYELLKTITILYVEDELALQENIYQNILPFVKKIFCADNGLEGLELYKKEKENIDLIITDILMPKMNGMEMVDEIRKIDLDVPVIYSTAFSDNKYLKRTIEQCVISYITKPIDIEVMLNSIEKASVKIENKRLEILLQETNRDLKKLVDEKTKELQSQNEQLYYQLYTDRLTQLPNRKALRRDMKSYINPVLLIIDIDRFKNINDLYGEYIGNLVLVAVSKILQNFAKENDYKLYRIGSDEFVLIRESQTDLKSCKRTVDFIIKSINSEPIDIVEYDIAIGVNVTVGISKEKKNILESADMALKKAKNDRAPYLIYSGEYNLDTEYKNDIEWTRKIENAIKSNSIEAYYQPIVGRNSQILKYEALMRLVDGESVSSPVEFLDIAKKVKLYPALERIMIENTFKKAVESGINVNINLSIEDVIDDEFVKYIEQELIKHNIAHLITFELLENENIKDYEKVIFFINIVKKLGCKIAIDDFGSGYSNFAYLVRLDPDYIKIDGSLVKNIDSDETSYLIVKSINSFAHSLGIKSVAEYVHSKEVFDKLKDIGVDEYQGFYFSEPLKQI